MNSLAVKVLSRYLEAKSPGKTTRPPPGKFQPRNMEGPLQEWSDVTDPGGKGDFVDITEVTKEAHLRAIQAVIRKEKGKGYCVKSPNNPDWNGGCYPSEGEAKKRLEQVDYFKNK